MTNQAVNPKFRLTYRVWKVWRRNFDVFMKTWQTNFLPSLLEPILYLLAFGFGLGTFVNVIEGTSYIQWIAPGLVAITVMYGAFFECTYASFVRMYFQRTFNAIIATPISVEEVIAGEILWGATRATINATIVLGVIAAFGLISSPWVFCMIPVAFVAGLLFSAMGMCFTAIAPSIDFFNYPIFLFITPMFLISNTFIPLSTLPEAIQTIALATLPLTHIANLSRILIIGEITTLGGLSPQIIIILAAAWTTVVTIALFALSIYLMKKRLIR
ncbi:MAG: ABC transporter permease [Candidatus Bathyarchaeota archaeon]|nr:ABC transporter permease [Candidatus Bathyarchaeota archaeon]